MDDFLLVLFLAVLLDVIFGEPRNAVHPTVWMGKVIARLKDRKTRNGRIYGAAIFFLVVALFTVPAYLLMLAIRGDAVALFLGAVLLKTAFSWKALPGHAAPIAELVDRSELDKARKKLARIVGRDTTGLDEEHIVSAAVESVAESSADGIISPMFYYIAFAGVFGVEAGIAAAVFYRVANTLDSMIGYIDKYPDIGFFSAKVDDLLNFIPSRISALLILLVSVFLREDWKNGIKIFLRDRKKTRSPNSGQPMAAMAGVLGVRLEKIGFYILGEQFKNLSPEYIYRALKIVDASVIAFILAASFFGAW